MGYYYLFYVERQTGGEWGVPPDLPSGEESWTEEERRLGCFTWTQRGYSSWCELFFGDDPLIRMRKGEPPSLSEVGIVQSLRAKGYDPVEDHSLTWIPYLDLDVDSWCTFPITLQGKVPAWATRHFGHGNAPYPREELLAAGLGKLDVDRIWERGRLTELPIDVEFGAERYRVTTLDWDTLVAVTWQESISDRMRTAADDFKKLRAYGEDDKLRILCTLS